MPELGDTIWKVEDSLKRFSLHFNCTHLSKLLVVGALILRPSKEENDHSQAKCFSYWFYPQDNSLRSHHKAQVSLQHCLRESLIP